jgi:hypothetical protein
MLATSRANIHNVNLMTILALGGTCAWWLSPVFFIANLAYIRQARQGGRSAKPAEIALTVILAVGSVALLAALLWHR